MNVRLIAQMVFGLGYVAVYILWSRLYYRLVDPVIRARIGELLGAKIIWVHRRGDPSGSEWNFRLRYNTWSWAIADERQRGTLKDGLIYVLWLLLVLVVFGLWPFTLFLFVFFGADFLHALVALPLLFITIPIYSIYWAGRYEVAGMRRPGDAG